MRVAAEVSGKSVDQRQGADADHYPIFSEIRIQLAIERNFLVCALTESALKASVIRRSRAHAQGSGAGADFLTITGAENKRTDTQLIFSFYFKVCLSFGAFAEFKRTFSISYNAQVIGSRNFYLDRCVGRDARQCVGNTEHDIKLIARHDRH